MTKYTVSQTFETLGDPCAITYDTRAAAETGADQLRAAIADMVSKWETPHEQDLHPTGNSADITAWGVAEEIAGVDYDDEGERTPDSPRQWGAASGKYIALRAVTIDEETTEATQPPPATRHALTGAEAVRLLSEIRAALWREPSTLTGGFMDWLDPDKDQDIETLDAIADTLADAGLAPTAPEPYQDIALAPDGPAALATMQALADAAADIAHLRQCNVDLIAERETLAARLRDIAARFEEHRWPVTTAAELELIAEELTE